MVAFCKGFNSKVKFVDKLKVYRQFCSIARVSAVKRKDANYSLSSVRTNLDVQSNKEHHRKVMDSTAQWLSFERSHFRVSSKN